MPTIDLTAGFTVAADPPTIPGSLTVTVDDTGPGRLTVTDPNGNIWLDVELGAGGAYNRDGIDPHPLTPGDWTSTAAGPITATLLAADV